MSGPSADDSFEPILGVLPSWSPEEGTAFEVAEWVLGILTSRISAAIHAEKQRPDRDEEKIARLYAEAALLAEERRRMLSGGPAAVQRVLDEYGPRARRSKADG